jgi:hypothetical protein
VMPINNYKNKNKKRSLKQVPLFFLFPSADIANNN